MVKFVEQEKIAENFLSETSDNASPVLVRTKRNEPPIKKTKLQLEEEKVNVQLETFANNFINQFCKRLGIYHLTAQGTRLTNDALKAELKTGSTAALVGMAITQNLLGSLPSLVASIRSLSSQYYLSKEKAQKITKVFEHVGPGHLSQVLSEAAVEIFQNFESQFMLHTDKAGDKVAMEKLAEDATARALNYIAEKTDPIPSITRELITQGVVFGKSEKFFDPSIKNVRIRISGNIVEDLFGKEVNTVNLYEKIGLVSTTNNGLKQFYKKNTRADSAEYGYRRPFSWEQEANGDLKAIVQSEYTQVVPQQENIAQYNLRRYDYLLAPELLDQVAKNIVEKIQNRYPMLSEVPSVQRPAQHPPVLFDLRKPVSNFIGRTRVLSELHSALLSNQNTAVIAQAMSAFSLNLPSSSQTHSDTTPTSLSGLGGIGKTQLALRYAETYAADYDNNVLWLNAETKGDLANSVKRLADKLKLETQDRHGNEKELETILDEVYGYFSAGKSLFIFDNVENYKEFANFLPKSLLGNKPSLLITSRYRNWESIASVIMLDVLSEEEGKELVKSTLKMTANDRSQDRKIQELIQLMQGLPLALQQAMAYITIQRNVNIQFSIQDYINLYKAKTVEILDFNFANYANDPYAKTVFTTWQLTLDKIRQDPLAGEKALETLNIMAYLCPDDIANNFFLPLGQTDKLGVALHLLKSYSMINEGSQQDRSTIHRLVQKVLRMNLEQDRHAFKLNIEKILQLTENYTSGDEVEFHYLHVLLYMNQHVDLAQALKLRVARKRILDIITYSEFAPNRLLYLLDTAHLIYGQEEYFKFIGEALFVYTRYPFLELLNSILNYLEVRLHEELISKDDINKILNYKYEIASEQGRVSRISAIPEERARQLDAVHILYEFEKKIFLTEDLPGCSAAATRKKRNVSVRCLVEREEQEITKQQHAQQIQQHLQKVSQVAQLASRGIFTKDMLSALLRGDLRSIAINFSLLATSSLVGEISNSFLTYGEVLKSVGDAQLGKNLALDGKLALSILSDEEIIAAGKIQFLGKAMQAASPFILRGTSVFFADKLRRQIKEYRAGNKQVLPGIISNGMIVSLDGVQSGIEAAEYVEFIEGVSVWTGPLGEGLAALVWLGSEVEQVRTQLHMLEKYVHLSETEKVIQSVRAFFNFSPSAYLQSKAANTQRAQAAIDFLKNHSDIKYFVFSIGNSTNTVLLNKRLYLVLDETIPDNLSTGNLFCAYGRSNIVIRSDQWIPIVPYPPGLNTQDPVKSYFCKNAIGVEYSLNRTHTSTLIALNAGDHIVMGLQNSANSFLIANGRVNYTGSNVSNLFLLQGDRILGHIDGATGANNKLSLENYNQNNHGYVLLDNQGLLCAESTRTQIIPQSCTNGLKIKNIQRVDGRKNEPDVIYVSGELDYIDSYGSESNDYRDHVYINNNSSPHPKIVLRNNLVVDVLAMSEQLETVSYRIPNMEIGETQVNLNFNGSISHRFYFDDISLDKLTIDIDERQVSFTHLLQNATFNITLVDNSMQINNQRLACPSNAYYILQDTEIKLVNKNNIYAQLMSNASVAEIMQQYPKIATDRNMTLLVRLPQNETVLIGHDRTQIFYNNVWGKSHLVGNGADNIYVISAASPNDFPIPEVTLYPIPKDKTDTLSLDELVKQAQQVCPEQIISPSVLQYGQDLVITLSAHYYKIQDRCVRLMTQWPIANIRLNNTLLDNSYQNLDIHLHSVPMNIIPDNEHWRLVYLPLVFNKNKETILLTEIDLEQESEFISLKKLGRYRFIQHNGTDLLLSNALDSDTVARDRCTIIFSQFYQRPEMRNKTLSAKFIFLDQEIILKNNVEQIHNASNFAEINKNYTAAATQYSSLSHDSSRAQRRHKRQADQQETRIQQSTAITDLADQFLEKYDQRLSKSRQREQSKKVIKNQKCNQLTTRLPQSDRQGFIVEKDWQKATSKSIQPILPNPLAQTSDSQNDLGLGRASSRNHRMHYQSPVKHYPDKVNTLKPDNSSHSVRPKLMSPKKPTRNFHHANASDMATTMLTLSLFTRGIREGLQHASSTAASRKANAAKPKKFNLPSNFAEINPQNVRLR